MKNIHKMMLANNYWNPITGTSFNAGLGYKPYKMKGGLIIGDDGIWREEDDDPDLMGFTVNPVTGYFNRNVPVADEFEEQLPNRIDEDNEEELANTVRRNRTNVNKNIIVKNPKLHKHNEPPKSLKPSMSSIATGQLIDPDINADRSEDEKHMFPLFEEGFKDKKENWFWGAMYRKVNLNHDTVSSAIDFKIPAFEQINSTNILNRHRYNTNITNAPMPQLTDVDKVEIKKIFDEEHEHIDFNDNNETITKTLNDLLPLNKAVEYKMVENSKIGLSRMDILGSDTDKLLHNYIGTELNTQLKNSKYLPFDDITSPPDNPESGTFDDFKLYYQYDVPKLKASYEKMYNEQRDFAREELKTAEEEKNVDDVSYDNYIKAKCKVDNFYLYFHTTQDYPYIPVTKSKFNSMNGGISTSITPTNTTVTINTNAIVGGGQDIVIKRKNATFRYITQSGVYGLKLNTDRGWYKNDKNEYDVIYPITSNIEIFDGKDQYKFPPTNLMFLHKNIKP